MHAEAAEQQVRLRPPRCLCHSLALSLSPLMQAEPNADADSDTEMELDPVFAELLANSGGLDDSVWRADIHPDDSRKLGRW